MSGLPLVSCPSCGARASLDVLIGHAGARDALLALARLHPAMSSFALVALRYIGLFAPGKREMGLDRVATILAELADLIGSGRVERHGRQWPAPLDAWQTGMESMLANRERLTLPLRSHGYLMQIVVSAAERAEGAAEAKTEQTRAYAYTQDRTSAPAPVQVAVAFEQREKTPIPSAVAEQLAALGIARKPRSDHAAD
ncbi:hypothetical protein [Rhodocyclus tenuis]|uniref:DUF2752 domain-containing protein n=1 Tax=Rhodocyclus tenuis TaxID=1066 RepID=A0A840G9B6_RHOTE|nr:hypothetical protein [Rhodocyclus tenuis]MBB4247278.1 hypothetical protein [Rhodocyclus tenuis]